MYDEICDLENLLNAYNLVCKGNRYKEAATRYSFFLESNLIKLHQDLMSNNFVPSSYNHFTIIDPKKRQIAAPAFQDRIVQHALVDKIEAIFDKTFITDAYACRKDKGTHFALKRLKKFLQASRTFYGKDKDIYVLKCDIRKYFSSISWEILLTIVRRKINCLKTYDLIEKIISTHQIYGVKLQKFNNQLSIFSSFTDTDEPVSIDKRKGLPIGNLTSQLFANVYLNELDKFVKHQLREKWYGRYMDDFLIISSDRKHLEVVREKISQFLTSKLKLTLHPRKSFIHNVKDGVCFVGYRVFWDHILVRGNTLLRMQKKYRKKVSSFKKGKIPLEKLIQTENSIRGHLKHANTFNLEKRLFGDEYYINDKKVTKHKTFNDSS